MLANSLFTSESVAPGHPDKIADQISDAILDACLRIDPNSRVAAETLIAQDLVILAGEITTKAHVNYEQIARQVIKEIGYDHKDLGFDDQSCFILVKINKQSPDIALGVNKETNSFREQGAGDQGLMFGFACDETESLMPLPIMLCHQIIASITLKRQNKTLPYLRPDGKCQVSVQYDSEGIPSHVHTVVISVQHNPDTSQKQIEKDMKELAYEVIPNHLLNKETLFYINPTGRFVIGGPVGDCGLTGRKIMVDTYGGMGRHGGGAFSGKDPSKVDRSAAYMARYIAKNIVAAGLAKRCEIQLAYAIGVPYPVSIKVETFGTSQLPENLLAKAVAEIFELSPLGMIEMLQLKRPIYSQTALGGHFGRTLSAFTWEQIDQVENLKKGLAKALYA